MQKRVFYFLILLLFVVLIKTSKAQHSELGFAGGVSFYTGELNPSPSPQNKLNPMLGVFYRKNFNYRYSLRVGLNLTRVAAKDKQNTNEVQQDFETRNLSFSSNLYDAYGILEFNFIPYQINKTASKFTPYVFIGLAGFYVAPKLENEVTNLSKETSLTSIAVPFGAGFKFNFASNIGASIEWSYRKTFTDKFDGIEETFPNSKQLSNTANKDWYSFINITLSYKILRKRDKCAAPIN